MKTFVIIVNGETVRIKADYYCISGTNASIYNFYVSIYDNRKPDTKVGSTPVSSIVIEEKHLG